MAKKTNWLLIILGIIIFIVIVGVGACVGFGYYMYRQMDITTANTSNPEEEFAKTRARFEGQTPYLEVPRDRFEDPIVHHELEKAEKTSLTGLYVMAYDPAKQQTVRVKIPMWLLRLGGQNLKFDAGSSGSVDVGRMKLTSDGLERFGKGIVMDVTKPSGERVLIWTE